MSKAPWKPTKQEEDFFKSVIMPLSAAMLSKYGTLENAIKANVNCNQVLTPLRQKL